MRDTAKPDPISRIPGEPGPTRTNPSALARLFDEWMKGDEVEQRETFEWLRRSLDEHRPAGYELFS